MNIGDKLKERRKQLKLTMLEVAKKANVSEATVSRWESGDIANMKRDKIVLLAKALQVSPSFIMEWEEEEAENIGIPYDASDTVKIPVYGNVSAGKGIFADDNIIGYESAESSDIVPGEEYFYLTVHGNSMFPMFLENDYILVKKQSSVDSGSFAVVLVDDTEAKVKKIVYGDDWIELQSVNPMYEPESYKGPDVLRIRILGLVKGMKRKF